MMEDFITDASGSNNEYVSDYKHVKKLPQVFAAFAATVGCFSMGTVLGFTSPVLPQLQASDSKILVSKIQGDWIGSLMAMGALVGAPVGGFLMDKLGRRGVIIFLGIPFSVGWMLITFAQSVEMLYAGRIITGMCTGCVALVVSMYIGEIAHPSIRGMLGTLIQVMIGVGVLFVYCVGVAISWQWLSFVCGCVPLIMILLLLFVPESPSYLLAKGRPKQAKDSLKWLRGQRYDIEEEMESLISSVHSSATKRVTLRELRDPVIWKPLVASLGLMILQQFSGVNNVIFYTQTIFQESGSSLNPSTCSILVGLTGLVSTVIASCLVDSWGRRKLLLLSDAIMTITLASLGGLFYLKQTMGTVSHFSLLCILLFIVGFSLGLAPIPWMMMGELFSPEFRELSGSIATCVNWGSAFLVTNTFSRLQETLGLHGTFWLYSGICAFGIVFVALAVPETKGKSLEEITNLFRNVKYDPLSLQETLLNGDSDSSDEVTEFAYPL